MLESVTLPALLDRKQAKAYLRVLESPEAAAAEWRDAAHPTERSRIEDMLALVNDGALVSTEARVSPERREALRAFLEERVAIRERASLMFPEFAKEAAAVGALARMPPQRTVALVLAWEALPPLLNNHVSKRLFFSNQGAAQWAKGRLKSTGKAVSVLLAGPGGELGITEFVECDSLGATLNYALALLLDKKNDIGAALCRCHAPGCGRFWLLPERLASKPTRNFCANHEAAKKKLSDAERKRRERQITREKAAAAAKRK
jgi:hypothetical protein